ncbi:MAG: aminopeptidase P family protein [Gemmatimonadaceae bacterium]|nr:aminopeptidase P family protein [Gemmatimonadaceae bacterium]
MPTLTPTSLPAVQQALRDAGLDGWLLFEFRGLNPIALQVIGLDAFLSRRVFVYVPAEGVPVAITHHIEQTVWHAWPAAWRRERYSAWTTLEELLQQIVGGRRIAMEYSPGNAVPFVDRVPAGMLEMIRGMGATVVSSADLVSRFNATWSPEQLASHERAAEHLRRIAHEAFAFAGDEARRGAPVHEHEVQSRILEGFARAGLETYSPPNVSVGANAADPHYEPSADHPQLITSGNIVLIDLWAREPGGVYADQTWMAVLGAPSERAREIWLAIRDARDAAVTYIRERLAAGDAVSGAAADDAARAVITGRGYGDVFTHRTGHSIDAREVHGSGPNLDNLETRDLRTLIDGVGFSIEPGIYLRGELGMRTEVNGFIQGRDLLITPREIQAELIIL